MCTPEIDFTPKRCKIVKSKLQNLVNNLKTFSKRTYFSKIEEELTELCSSKVEAFLNLKIVFL